MSIDWDEFSGRGRPEERWRIYRVADGGEPELVATAGSPEAVGTAIVTLGNEGEFDDYACGVLDSMPECPTCEGRGQVADTSSVMIRSMTESRHRGMTCPDCKGSGVKPTGSWALKPWCAAPREVSAAGRLLRSVRFTGGGSR